MSSDAFALPVSSQVKRALLVAFASVLAAAGCRPPVAPASAEPQQHEVRGIVRSIGFAQREITVEHEEIPGFMPAMTMPFSVKEMREVEGLAAGDAIRFQLIVTENDSWITEIKRIAAESVHLPPQSVSPPKDSTRATRIDEGDPLPDFELIDDQGRPITRARLAGEPAVLTFIFTRCPIPNFCPLMSKNFGAIHEMAARDPKLRGTQLLSISFDPEYDTPERLAQYAANHRPPGASTWRFATGSTAQIATLTAAFAVQVKPEGGTLSHGLSTALVDAKGVIRKIWRGNGWQPAEVIEELKKL